MSAMWANVPIVINYSDKHLFIIWMANNDYGNGDNGDNDDNDDPNQRMIML